MDADNIPIGFDSGCIVSITPYKQDFLKFSKVNKTITGVSSKAKVVGEVLLLW